MNERTLEVMPVNTLWALRQRIDATLAAKLLSEKREIEHRLARVNGGPREISATLPPQNHPKYFNPENPSQTWGLRTRIETALVPLRSSSQVERSMTFVS